MTQKKKKKSKILLNFMKIHKKKFVEMKNQYGSKKEKSFENTHKLYKNSKTFLDAQNEFTPKGGGQISNERM